MKGKHLALLLLLLALAGGGLGMGRVIGRSSRLADAPGDQPVTPAARWR